MNFYCIPDCAPCEKIKPLAAKAAEAVCRDIRYVKLGVVATLLPVKRAITRASRVP
ncbi:hypothetical protein [Streptomyces sp. NPDC059639]|uniref:hypothetical protein n=1 Tax=Streptomyces sp. NPDC059639 TaxID=3346891 RepID=UPI0036D1DBD6